MVRNTPAQAVAFAAILSNSREGNGAYADVIPELMEIVSSGAVQPGGIITQEQPLVSVIDAYRMFDEHRAGWLKVELRP